MLGTKISQVRALGSLKIFLERGLVCTFVPGRKMVGRFEGPVSSLSPNILYDESVQRISTQLVWDNFKTKGNFQNKWLICGSTALLFQQLIGSPVMSDKLHVLSHYYTNMQGWSFRLIHAYYTAPLQACSSSYKQ